MYRPFGSETPMARSSEPPQKRSVYVLEPHPVAMSHLAAVLERNPAIEVVPTSTNFISQATFPERSSVLIIDANALPFPLLPCLVTVRKGSTAVKILAIGKRISDDELCGLLSHGISGYIVYEKVEDEIGRAVDAVLAGHVWAPPRVLETYVPFSFSHPSPNQHEHAAFSPRESQVIGLLGRRLSNKEIGSELGITERTVRFHLGNIFSKVGVRNRYSVIDLLRAGGLTGSRQESPRIDPGGTTRPRTRSRVLQNAA